MSVADKFTIASDLVNAHPRCTAAGKAWKGDKKARVYLTDCQGAYIEIDDDGDLVGTGPKLSRAKAAQVWGPWEKAARTIGRKLYA